jgi:hypothetical protein
MKLNSLVSSLAGINNDWLPMTVYFDNGFIFKSVENTGVFESTNGLDMDDEGFFEYYAFFAKIAEVVALPENYRREEEPYKTGSFFELSEVNMPQKIELNNGEVIWKSQPL